MPPSKIMIIRHAEKPVRSDDKSLSPRGWQRAGALAVFLAHGPARALHNDLAQPDWIYASGTLTSGSLRPQQTVEPLGEKLQIQPNTFFNPSKKPGRPEISYEPEMIQEVLTKAGTVLISWQHEFIPLIGSLIPVGPEVTLPRQWNSERFDLIWVFDLIAGSSVYRFSEVPQQLLAGDL